MGESECSTELKPSLIGFPNEFPYEFDSPAFTSSSDGDQSSDDEEDFLAGLTRRLALSTQRVSIPSFPNTKSEGRVVSSSPQSTLSGLSSSSASGSGSPNGSSSRVDSPPTTPFLANKDETWEVIHRAAGEVARLKMTHLNHPTSDPLPLNLPKTQDFPSQSRHGEPQYYSNANQILSQKEAVNQQCYSDLASFWKTEPDYQKLGFQLQSRDVTSSQELRNLKQQNFSDLASLRRIEPEYQELGFQLQRRALISAQELRKYQKPLNFRQSGCPPRQLRQQLWQSRSPAPPPSATTIVSAKRQCAGTGVFLPRSYTNPSENVRKKQVCSPVLVPARVVHALNVNSEDMSCVSLSHLSSAFGVSYYDAVMAKRRALLLQHQRSLRQRQEMPLPQEWMY